MPFNTQFGPSQTAMQSQIANAAQNSRAQLTQVGLEQAGQIQANAANTIQNLRSEAERLNVSPSYLINKDKAVYEDAFNVLSQGNSQRTAQMMASFDDYPTTGAEALNASLYEEIGRLKSENLPLLDTTEMQDITEKVTGAGRSRVEVEAALKEAAKDRTFRAIAKQMGIEPEGRDEVTGLPIWPQDFKDWRDSIVDQIVPGGKWSPADTELTDAFWTAIQSGAIPDMNNKAIELSAGVDPTLDSGRTGTQPVQTSTARGTELAGSSSGRLRTGQPARTQEESLADQSNARRRGIDAVEGTQTSTTQPQINQALASGRVTQDRLDFGVGGQTGAPAERIVGQKEVVTEKGFATRLSELATGVSQQAPNVASNALLEAQALRDARSTTSLKEAQARQLNSSVRAMEAGTPEKMSEQEQWYYKQLGNEFEVHLKEMNEMITNIDKITEEQLGAWNANIEAKAKMLGVSPIDLNQGGSAGLSKGHLWWKSDLPLLSLPGIMNMGSISGANQSGTYDTGSLNALLEN